MFWRKKVDPKKAAGTPPQSHADNVTEVRTIRDALAQKLDAAQAGKLISVTLEQDSQRFEGAHEVYRLATGPSFSRQRLIELGLKEQLRDPKTNAVTQSGDFEKEGAVGTMHFIIDKTALDLVLGIGREKA